MKYLLLLITLIILTACSPKYIIKTHYQHPLTKTGSECIKTCEYKRDRCQTSCNNRNNICLDKAKRDAKDNLPNLFADYDMDMVDYQHDMDRYRFELDRWDYQRNLLQREYRISSDGCARLKSIYKKNKSSKTEEKKNRLCKKNSQIKKRFYHYRDDLKPTEPSKPIKPSLSHEIKKFQKNCSQSCSCTKSYDSCFISCGGKLSYQKICVDNCK
jgi:hypothetical protein